MKIFKEVYDIAMKTGLFHKRLKEEVETLGEYLNKNNEKIKQIETEIKTIELSKGS